MAASIRIQHLQRGGGAIAAIGCLILGGNLVVSNLADFRRYDRAVSALERFQSVLAAAEAVSSERGPSNSAMGPTAGQERARIAALAAKRAETDAHLGQVRAAFGDEIAASQAMREGLETLERHLIAARALVDAVADMPLDRRDGTAVARAIEAMFVVADDATAVRDHLGEAVIRSAPQVSTEILLQSSANTMREEAGRLGSYVVMLLAGGATREGIAPRLAKAGARVQQSWNTLAGYGQAYSPTGAVRAALDAVRQDYFAHSWVIAHETAARTGTPNLSVDAFTQLYVPGLDAPTRLRDRLGEALRLRMAGLREAAFINMVMSGILTSLVLAILVALGLMFRNRLFHPLIAAREEILAIARGDLSEPPRDGRASREIGEMFDGLTRLRDEQRQKQRLEEEQRRLTRQLQALSEIDPLTGLLNRRALGERAAEMLAEADRRGRQIGLVLFDLDNFKGINDRHGHAVGDLVLGSVRDRLRPVLDPADLLVRYGGEEFLVLLADVEGEAAEAAAERLRAALGGTPIVTAPRLTVTGSFGLALRRPGADWESLVSLADRRLYRAKLEGRNRVCADGGEEPESRFRGIGQQRVAADAA